jgi:hypothetical protein
MDSPGESFELHRRPAYLYSGSAHASQSSSIDYGNSIYPAELEAGGTEGLLQNAASFQQATPSTFTLASLDNGSVRSQHEPLYDSTEDPLQAAATSTIAQTPPAQPDRGGVAYQPIDPGHDAGGPRLQGTAIPSKLLQLKWTLLLWATTTALAAFASFYFYETLINKHPKFPHLLSSPTVTVRIVTVLSAVQAIMLSALFVNISEHFRWLLACRPGGVSLTTFLIFSSSTSTLGVLQLLLVPGRHVFWGLQR